MFSKLLRFLSSMVSLDNTISTSSNFLTLLCSQVKSLTRSYRLEHGRVKRRNRQPSILVWKQGGGHQILNICLVFISDVARLILVRSKSPMGTTCILKMINLIPSGQTRNHRISVSRAICGHSPTPQRHMCLGSILRSREKPQPILPLMGRLNNPLLVQILQIVVPLVAALSIFHIISLLP